MSKPKISKAELKAKRQEKLLRKKVCPLAELDIVDIDLKKLREQKRKEEEERKMFEEKSHSSIDVQSEEGQLKMFRQHRENPYGLPSAYLKQLQNQAKTANWLKQHGFYDGDIESATRIPPHLTFPKTERGETSYIANKKTTGLQYPLVGLFEMDEEMERQKNEQDEFLKDTIPAIKSILDYQKDEFDFDELTQIWEREEQLQWEIAEESKIKPKVKT